MTEKTGKIIQDALQKSMILRLQLATVVQHPDVLQPLFYEELALLKLALDDATTTVVAEMTKKATDPTGGVSL